MLYFTGDTHGEELRFIEGNIPGESLWTEEDHLIICGDFGYVLTDSFYERKFLDYLETKPYTICFCDGNHENFPCIFSYPEEQWNGGRIHRIRKNIIHLMRGQIYGIEGKTVFSMGGAYSRDKIYRREGFSWWSEEMPTEDEYREAEDNLKKHGNRVDIIVSHTAPTQIIAKMGKQPDPQESPLTDFLDGLANTVSFDRWFFGHWHLDKKIDERFRALYFDVEK